MFYGQKAERIHRRTMGGGCHQVVVAVLLVVVMAAVTEGHGRVWEPPQRATMWRRGFDTTRDYNDNSLYCGGFKRLYMAENVYKTKDEEAIKPIEGRWREKQLVCSALEILVSHHRFLPAHVERENKDCL
ncbi:hypothetical protein C0Q70_11941 [Pomacea canaliculata]|uniref:Uncharacterized protein n=1 Tax=Pomacea canaliculata TaxID=400727 RepID=A0A2T7P7G5_POMCA|nr:hypothetical protein C0Q70_11941 [Pomacea canaliculata]